MDSLIPNGPSFSGLAGLSPRLATVAGSGASQGVPTPICRDETRVVGLNTVVLLSASKPFQHDLQTVLQNGEQKNDAK